MLSELLYVVSHLGAQTYWKAVMGEIVILHSLCLLKYTEC